MFLARDRKCPSFLILSGHLPPVFSSPPTSKLRKGTEWKRKEFINKPAKKKNSKKEESVALVVNSSSMSAKMAIIFQANWIWLFEVWLAENVWIENLKKKLNFNWIFFFIYLKFGIGRCRNFRARAPWIRWIAAVPSWSTATLPPWWRTSRTRKPPPCSTDSTAPHPQIRSVRKSSSSFAKISQNFAKVTILLDCCRASTVWATASRAAEECLPSRPVYPTASHPARHKFTRQFQTYPAARGWSDHRCVFS